MSDVNPDMLEPGQDDDNVWDLLRQAREARGLTLGQVSAHLKLTVRQIEAIESGDLSVLPGQTFARGFVRNYARFLDLDPAMFLADSAPAERFVIDEASERAIGSGLGQMPVQGARRFSALPAVFLVLLLLIILGSGWHYGWFEAREDQQLLAASGSAPVVEVPLAASTAQSAPPAQAASAPEPVTAASTVTAEVRAEASAVSSVSSASSAAVAVAASAPVAAPVLASAPAVVGDAAGLPRLVFNFDGDSWVEVRDGSGKTVFARLNTAGSTQEIQGMPPFDMVIGNAAHVRLSWKGAPVDLKPATRGEVARISVK